MSCHGCGAEIDSYGESIEDAVAVWNGRNGEIPERGTWDEQFAKCWPDYDDLRDCRKE